MAVLVGPPEINQLSSQKTTSTTRNTPPEIYQKPAAASTTADAATDDAFGDHVKNTILNHRQLRMGLTENDSPTFLSSGNPCLDFFFHIVPDTPPHTVIDRLQLAWNHDPLKALKLVCNLRGVKGTGKSDKEGFYSAVLWMHEHHPRTLAANVAAIAKFGYFKDLLEILFRILEGADARKSEKEIGEKWKSVKSAKLRGLMIKKDFAQQKKNRVSQTLMLRRREWRKEMIESWKKFQTVHTQTSEAKRIERAKRVVERFNEDSNFKLLHERISDVFAQHLRSDMEMLKSGKLNKISLAAKWCPSLDSSFDKITLLCETIAKKVFPREEYAADYEGVEEAHYAYRVRDRLRKEVLVPLRKALQLPEVYIGANDWGSLRYKRVASVAMQTYKSKFLKHDKGRFKKYLKKVKSGKAKISAGALLPRQIIACLDEEEGEEVAELQWKRMVDDIAQKGKLKNCLAICDVSGSMDGIPMEVSVALGVLVSELSEEPWKGKLITFSESPELQKLQGESLKSKTEFVRYMDWGMNTDFQKVFDVILQVAVKGKLKGEEMIKRLFVFSDMEFDQASVRPWETDYEAIVRKYGEKGYGDCVPEIVFWNLRDSWATPVPGKQAGVALVSGYSKNLMTLFLDGGGILDPEAVTDGILDPEAVMDGILDSEPEKDRIFDPEAVMDAAIAGEEYQKLIVLD